MAEEACIFCRILSGEVPAGIAWESPYVVAFMSNRAYHRGHALVIPRRHIATIYELPDELTGPLLLTTVRVARAARTAFAADGITIRQHNEPAGGQEVFHLHFHVIPRYTGDDERMKQSPALIDLEEQRCAAALLRRAVDAYDR